MEALYLKVLEKSDIFRGFKQEEISELFDSINYRIKSYSQNEIIASEGDKIRELAIVLSGEVNVEKIYITGKVIKIKKMIQGDLIGHVSVFSDFNFYPSSITANNSVTILYIPQEDIINTCRSNVMFLNNFMRLISNQTIYLSNKLRFISYETIRKKLCYFILEEYKKQGSLKIKVYLKRKEMAETFGVTRPALSNELIKMKNDGLIDYKKNIIEIKDVYEIENELL